MADSCVTSSDDVNETVSDVETMPEGLGSSTSKQGADERSSDEDEGVEMAFNDDKAPIETKATRDTASAFQPPAAREECPSPPPPAPELDAHLLRSHSSAVLGELVRGHEVEGATGDQHDLERLQQEISDSMGDGSGGQSPVSQHDGRLPSFSLSRSRKSSSASSTANRSRTTSFTLNQRPSVAVPPTPPPSPPSVGRDDADDHPLPNRATVDEEPSLPPAEEEPFAPLVRSHSLADLHARTLREVTEGVKESKQAQRREVSEHLLTSLIPGPRSLLPMVYMAVFPVAVVVLFFTLTELDGSLRILGLEFATSGVHWYRRLNEMRDDAFHRNGWIILLGLIGLQWLLKLVVPGRHVMGPQTKGGYAAIYRTNGLLCFLITMALYDGGVRLKLYRGGFVCENLGKYIACANIFYPIVALLLYIKGRTRPTNEVDAKLTGDIFVDYFNGVELHPKSAWVYVKHFFVYNVAHSLTGLIVISAVYSQNETFRQFTPASLVCAALHLLRLCRFQLWESGYISSRSETVDRAGFREIWGSCVALPVVYCSQVIYMVYHPSKLGLPVCLALLVAGILCMYMGYESDVQKQLLRESHATSELRVWGAAPKFIRARYWTEEGQVRINLLLRSGWWGIARHINYVPEVLFGICLTLPVYTRQPLAYLYIPFITLLLIHRAYVDDKRSQKKYTGYWDSYKYYVPDLIIPGVF